MRDWLHARSRPHVEDVSLALEAKGTQVVLGLLQGQAAVQLLELHYLVEDLVEGFVLRRKVFVLFVLALVARAARQMSDSSHSERSESLARAGGQSPLGSCVLQMWRESGLCLDHDLSRLLAVHHVSLPGTAVDSRS